MKTYFKEFNEEFFKGKGLPKVNWFDREGVYSIPAQFEEHLTMIHKQLDSRYTKTDYYHAWLNDEKLDWYMSRPKDTKEMCERIFEWVNYFK